MENYCEHWAEIEGFGGGLGLDGGMADYMLVPAARQLVPLGSLRPATAAPLSDAALTPYHAIKRALPFLDADGTVVVMGVGGLGHMAIQLLGLLAPVRVVAADVDDKKLEQAKALGAHDVINNRNAVHAAERIRQITGARGASLVLDCVGVRATVDLGASLLGRNSLWTVVGLGGGHHDFHHGSTPYGCSLSIPYWGSRVELMDVIAMARNGRIHAETTEFPLEQAVAVYERLKAGQITGRAVLVP
jgi:propanol-preferring alcohol dehydrogenase